MVTVYDKGKEIVTFSVIPPNDTNIRKWSVLICIKSMLESSFAEQSQLIKLAPVHVAWK